MQTASLMPWIGLRAWRAMQIREFRSVSLAVLFALLSSANSQAQWAWTDAQPPLDVSPTSVVENSKLSSPIDLQPPHASTAADGYELDSDIALTDYSSQRSRWLDGLSVFVGLDGSKQPQDFGVNAQFGGRASVNWGVPILADYGIGAQLGTAIDATADAVQVIERVQGSTGRTQNFTTAGVFQRTDWGLMWGVVYDFLQEDYYDNFSLGQWRVDVAYQLNARNRVGVWSAIRDHGDDGFFGPVPLTLTPITQTNIYYMHEWQHGIQTTFWGGIANGHGQVNAALGDLAPLKDLFVYGSQLSVPLTDRIEIFGQANFITPANSGTVDAYLGFTFYPYGSARPCSRSWFAPWQTVAAPTNFAVDLKRR